MLGAVAGVAERLAAGHVLADVRSLARVRSQVDLQVLQPRERLVAARALRITTTTLTRSAEMTTGAT